MHSCARGLNRRSGITPCPEGVCETSIKVISRDYIPRNMKGQHLAKGVAICYNLATPGA